MRGRVIIAAALLLGACAAVAQPVTLAVPRLASLLEPDGSGIYQQLIGRALESMETEIDPGVYPYRRALRAFENGKTDCLVSLSDILKERHDEANLIYSYPLGRFAFHIFTPDDRPTVTSVEWLEGRRVGAIMGHEFYLDEVLDDHGELVWVRSEEQAVRMLERGRFEALIAAIPDIYPLLDGLRYAGDQPVLEGYDRVNCHDTPRNREFVESLSEQLKALKKEGVYQEIAGELYVPF